jgi:hypothetical protein
LLNIFSKVAEYKYTKIYTTMNGLRKKLRKQFITAKST